MVKAFNAEVTVGCTHRVGFVNKLTVFVLNVRTVLRSLPKVLTFFWLFGVGCVGRGVCNILFGLFGSAGVGRGEISFVVSSGRSFGNGLSCVRGRFRGEKGFRFRCFCGSGLSVSDFEGLSDSGFVFLGSGFFPLTFVGFGPRGIVIRL